MAGLFWYDGAWSSEEPKLLGPMDHAMWQGSVIFDGARGIHGWAPDLDRHCARAVRSALAMGMKPTKTAEEIEALAREAVGRMGPEAEVYIRPMFFIRRAIGSSQPDPDSTDFLLAVYDAPLPGFTGFSAMMTPFRRPTPDMAPTGAKAACLYPNSQRAAGWARSQGADNAVLCDAVGNVAEFATSNIWFAKDGVVVTPAPNQTFLNGITRQRIMKLLREAGVTVEERSVAPEELESADEIFSTGNFAKVQPVIRYNGRDLQPGPFALKARELYFAWMKAQPRVAAPAAVAAE
ncbi:branched-chain amino acid aminotransferase [Roseococcus sp. YIM B11640]|uniref:branched-chain amino acid aminotransferase n=1 Tax=Roseococcus sp. YIM B11640 TaxID=3133973 RepID=UPI003C7992A8